MMRVSFHTPFWFCQSWMNFASPHLLGIFVPWVMKTVDADLHDAIVGDGIDLKCSGNKFAGDFAADVVFHTIDGGLLAAAEAADVVIELQIFVQQGRERFQVAVVVCVEKLRIQRLNRLEERVGRGLCLNRYDGNGEQRAEKKYVQTGRAILHEVTFSIIREDA